MRTRMKRQAPILTAALAVTALGLAAGLLTASPVRATPPAGVTPEILGSGTTLAGFKIHVDGIKVESKTAVGFTVEHLTFAPGGTTGWHVHPGPTLVIVKAGAVTNYSAADGRCRWRPQARSAARWRPRPARAARPPGRADLVQPRIHLGVHPGHEERGHRRDRGQVPALSLIHI